MEKQLPQRPIIGILGLGSIGKRHRRNFESLGCKTIGFDPMGSSHSRGEVLRDASVIVVCTPTVQHANDIYDCTALRKPMFVEKPIVTNRAQLASLDPLAVMMVGYNLRFHSCVRKARNWLASGTIGKPLWARFTCAQFNDRPDYARDGVTLNWSHEIDLARYLLGECEVVGSSICRNDGISDIILQHHNHGCQTTVHLDYVTKPERRGFVVVGDDGSIEADLVQRQAYCKNRNGGLLHNHFGRDSFDGNYVTEAKAFLNILGVEGEAIPDDVSPCTAHEAMRVVDICLRAKEQ